MECANFGSCYGGGELARIRAGAGRQGPTSCLSWATISASTSDRRNRHLVGALRLQPLYRLLWDRGPIDVGPGSNSARRFRRLASRREGSKELFERSALRGA